MTLAAKRKFPSRLPLWQGLFLALLLAVGLTLFTSPSVRKKPLFFAGKTMGTTYHIQYFPGPHTPKRHLLGQRIDQTLKALNKQMSTYQKDSEIALFNAHRDERWVEISNDFYTVLRYSLTLAKKTHGLFDPTIGPLVNLWGFGPGGKKKVPTSKEIKETKSFIGYQKVKMTPTKIRKTNPRVQIDLSASAKGFGVDKIAALLHSSGVKNYLVEIGGELKAKGQGPRGPWKVAIQRPSPTHPHRPSHKILALKDQAVATSGDYLNFFREGNKKYSHTLDFRTGRPIQHTLSSVTVVHPESCLKADALATALNVMGLKKGLEFAQREKIAAYFIYRGNSGTPLTRGSSLFNKLYGKGSQ